MTSIFDHHSSETTKMMILGEQGTGKTGLIASLVAMGYEVFLSDHDNGADALKMLLTSDKYPYRKYMQDHNIKGFLQYETITERMTLNKSENRPVPKSASAFGRAMALYENWKDSKTGESYGNIDTWGTNRVLCIDTLSTLADLAFNNIQALNRRLGARREGFDYQRDVGGAQAVIGDLVKLLYDPAIKCNVIINTHVTWVDENRGIAERPVGRQETLTEIKGYPSIIGRALSPIIGKYFNNVLYISQSGSGSSVKRELWTVPRDGVKVKSAAQGDLRLSYPIETALAEIFAILRGEDPPTDFINMCRPKSSASSSKPSASTNANSPAQIPAKAPASV